MRVLNVVSVLSAHDGGGNAERTAQLSRELARSGDKCTVLTLDIGNPEARRTQLGAAQLILVPSLNRRFQVPDLVTFSLTDIVHKADVIHLMGYWSLLCVAVARIAERQGIPYVISPAGALPLFGRSQLIKRLFNQLVGHRMVRRASGWIAVTAAELPDFQSYGVDPLRVNLIPNGVVEADFATAPISSGLMLPRGPFVLFMGRLNRIKGPDLLLDAFIQVAQRFPQLELVFAGPDEGLEPGLRRRAQEAGLVARVHFLGFVSGTGKTMAYRAASILVVPSRQEAMSIVAVEAGVCGTPVLMTDQCGLDDLREVDSELVVQATPQALAIGLIAALADEARLREWGLTWQGIVRQRFLWSDIGRRFRDYLGMLGRKGH
jgi:glycosyltransferase involved in cell wall biosynthesis